MVIFKHYWLVNVALTAALGVVSARTVAGTIERGLAVPPATTAASRSGPSAPITPPPVRSGVIVERNLFNSKSPGGVVEASAAAAGRDRSAPAAPTLPPLNARLIGTVLADDGGFAIIEDTTNRRQELYRLNEVVLRDARLVAIERDRVRLRRGGKTEVLELAFVERAPGPVLPPVASAPAPAAGSGIAQTGTNRYVIDQREIDSALENMNQLLTQARMVPFFSAGKAEGFRIFAIRPNSLFEKIGLRDGDVLQRINGNDLTDPARAFELFEQLRDEKEISVDLVRNGARQTLSYEIR
ncbi:MAG TPA: type II secretion system protein GspC [Thermodesulfobacteriota bacterium]